MKFSGYTEKASKPLLSFLMWVTVPLILIFLYFSIEKYTFQLFLNEMLLLKLSK